MLNRIKVIAAYWWLRRRKQKGRKKRRYYIRPAHQNLLADSFRLFHRYYESEDPLDLEGFCRLSPENFDSLYAKIESKLTHMTTHRRPITEK